MRSFKLAATLFMALVCTASLSAFSLTELFSQSKPKSQTIKVLLMSQSEAARVEIQGSYNLFDPRTGHRLGTRFLGKSQTLQAIPEGLKWGEEFPGTYQIEWNPDHGETQIVVDGFQFSGNLYAYQIDGAVSLVCEIDIEDYVTALLSTKFASHTPAEVMSALAITLRTDAYHAVLNSPSRFWDVSADQVGYQGYSANQRSWIAEDAVNLTRQLVMLNHDGSGRSMPFAATWTENSAGKTAPYHLMYRQDGHAPSGGVESPYARSSREVSQWSSRVTKMELAQLANLDRITKITLLRDSASNKVFGIRFEDGAYTKEVDYHTLVSYLGRDTLQSSEFLVNVEGDVVHFQGVGRGSGVGVCLYSAERMAERGADARKILSTFYPTSFLELAPRAGLDAGTLAEFRKAGQRRLAY